VVLSGRRETHPRYLWNIECECRAGSKCAVVFAAPGGGLATLHLRHLSAVPGRSYGEWILHSKLHLPALLAIHSAALARRANDVVDRDGHSRDQSRDASDGGGRERRQLN
jgi:hypothetical protein